MEDFVLTIEQCKHLQELGLDMRKAKFCWTKGIFDEETKHSFEERDWEWHVEKIFFADPEYPFFYCIPAYTFQEIWDILPKEFQAEGATFLLNANYDATSNEEPYEMSYVSKDCTKYFDSVRGNSWRDVAYEMLCQLIKNNHFK